MAAKANVNAICISGPRRTQGSNEAGAPANPTEDENLFTPLMLAIGSDACSDRIGNKKKSGLLAIWSGPSGACSDASGIGRFYPMPSVCSVSNPEVGVRHLHIARALIAAKASVNIADTRQNTALHLVVSIPGPKKRASGGTMLPNEESIELLNILITSRADVHVKNCDQRTALYIATSSCAVKVLLSAKVC